MFNNFLRKNFVIIAILFFYTGPATAGSLVICSDGYYLSACDETSIGTNWLKGIKGENTDYYSYGLPDSDTTNITNLRKFFAGSGTINYTTTDNQPRNVDKQTYIDVRNKLLKTFCTKNWKLVHMDCKKCPNDAKVPESTVQTNEYSSNDYWTSWDVHSVADCYMDEMTDNTGTYVYETASGTPQTCYYSNNIEGDELVSE